MPNRIGVFVCWCGANIASTVNIEQVTRAVSAFPEVVFVKDYMYMCSDPGQQLVKDHICEDRLNGAVVACCSPRMHENTFRKAAESVDLNPYRLEIANIREQCAWVHQNEPEKATEKAINIIHSTLEKVRKNLSLQPIDVQLNKRTLVIGGGVTGMSCALELAEAGYEVVVVEKTPIFGGALVKLNKTFPYLEKAEKYIDPLIEHIREHPRIRAYTKTHIQEIEGYVGNFRAHIKRDPEYVADTCDQCGECTRSCPVTFPDRLDEGLRERKAIDYYVKKGRKLVPTIDPLHCLQFQGEECNRCVQACPRNCIDFSKQAEIQEEAVGAIIIATGFELYDLHFFKEYEAAETPDIISGLAFERMLDEKGPTHGEVIRPSTSEPAQSVLWVKCAGSRDPEFHKPYCSRVCCLYTTKQAKLFKEKNPKGSAFISYMDIRTDTKDGEEFYQEVVEEGRVVYLRGRVSKIYRNHGKLAVSLVDTLSRIALELEVDLVVLATAMVPSEDISVLAKEVRATLDEHGFLTESHIKLYPVESSTKGVFLAGCAQAPKDITDSVSQGIAAAGKVMTLFSSDVLQQDPLVARVDRLVCSGCGICTEICPYDARELNPRLKYAEVNQALCEGCGACIASCPNKACELFNQTTTQTFEMLHIFQERESEQI